MEIKAIIEETNRETTIIVDLEKYPSQNGILGKMVGEKFSFPKSLKTYRIIAITKKQ